MVEFARDLLMGRGALVETEEGGALRAMLPADLAKTLEAADWLSLRFGAGAGSDDEGEWLERLARLFPPTPRVTWARVRRTRPVRAIDPAEVLERELVVQNGIQRLVDHGQTVARYFFFTLPYTVESDERTLGIATAVLNASACSMPRQPEVFLQTVADDLEEDAGAAPADTGISHLFPVALGSARPEIRRLAAAVEQNANRRLARDADRIHSYYEGMLREIRKRAARKPEPDSAEKVRSRAEAVERDRAAKLEDLARKYALRVHIEVGDVLAVALPVVEIVTRVIRKKEERLAKFHWNPALGKLESPWCEACFAPAHPLFLCDTRVHFLCRACAAACERCGKHLCRACQPRCRCG